MIGTYRADMFYSTFMKILDFVDWNLEILYECLTLKPLCS